METVITPLHAKQNQPDDALITRKTIFIEPKLQININFNNPTNKTDYKKEHEEIDEEVKKLAYKNVVSICVEPDINSEEFMVSVKQEYVNYFEEMPQHVITSECEIVKKKHKEKTSSPKPLRNWFEAPPYCKEVYTNFPDDYLNNCYQRHNAQPSIDEMDTYPLINENHTYVIPKFKDIGKTTITTFSCSYCNYRANDRSTLAKHINSKHTKTTVFNCSYCNYKTYQKGHLGNHINAKHTKDSCFSCPYCAYTTYHKSNINKHVNSRHTKVTHYSCSYCSYKAYRKGHLNQHVNAKHTESTVFNCSYCSYKAYQKGNLSRHVEAKHADVNKNGD